jgi:hypothetical protein
MPRQRTIRPAEIPSSPVHSVPESINIKVRVNGDPRQIANEVRRALTPKPKKQPRFRAVAEPADPIVTLGRRAEFCMGKTWEELGRLRASVGDPGSTVVRDCAKLFELLDQYRAAISRWVDAEYPEDDAG